jgi:glycosyltransferase involved in cell wall biosynthesis
MAERVTCVPYPVDGIAEPYLERNPRKTVLYVGRVHPEKGIDLLIEAFSHFINAGLRDWKLRIVGPWEVKHGGGGEKYLHKLRTQAQSIWELVEWIGPIFNKELLNKHYQESALFVYPSLAERGETFGLAPLEAMAAGCPPVVSSLECFRDFIEPGVNGWVFDHRAGDPAANLANAMKMAAENPGILSRVGAVALQTAKNYSLSRVADRYLQDFEEIIGQ